MMKKIFLVLMSMIYVISAFSATITGSVTDSINSEPIEGANVFIQLTKPGETPISENVQTGSDGQYSFTTSVNIVTWYLEITVSKIGYYDGYENNVINLGDPLDYDFPLNKTGAIEGYVTIEEYEDNLVTNVTISLTSQGGAEPETISPNDEGYYFFNELDSGTYNLTATLNDFYEVYEYPDEIPIDSVVQTLETIHLELKPSDISGNVTLEGGSGVISNVEVKLEYETGVPIITNPNANGDYEFTDVAPGDVTITAELDGYSSSDEQNGTVIPGQDLEGKDFTLTWIEEFGQLTGTITNENEQAVVGAIVSIGGNDDTTGEDGTYSFDELAPGTFEFKVTADGYLDFDYEIKIDTGNNTFDTILTYKPIINEVADISTLYAIIDETSIPETFDVECQYLSDNLIIEVDAPFMLAKSESSEYSNIINIEPENGSVNQTIYVKFNPTASQEYTESITLSSVNADDQNINVSGQGLAPLEVDIETESILVCPGENVLLEAVVSGGYEGDYTYEWDNGETSAQIIVSPSQDKTYQVIVSDELGNQQSAQKSIEVYDALVFTTQPENVSICEEQSTLFEVELLDTEDVTFKWMLNDTVLSDDDIYNGTNTNQLIVSKAASEMNGNIYKCKISRCGDSYSEEAQLRVYGSADLNFSSQPMNNVVCRKESAEFEVQLEDDEEVVYQWMLGEEELSDNGIYSGTQSPKLTIAETELIMSGHLYKCNVHRCVDKVSDEVELLVNEIPGDQIIAKGKEYTIVLISPDSGMLYQWYENDQLILGETKQFYYPTSGFNAQSNYFVEVTNEFGCTTRSEQYLVSTKAAENMIYPNPFSNHIVVNTTHLGDSDLSIRIMDLFGKEIYSQKLSNVVSTISLEQFQPGVYSVQIVNQSKMSLFSQKIIKK